MQKEHLFMLHSIILNGSPQASPSHGGPPPRPHAPPPHRPPAAAPTPRGTPCPNGGRGSSSRDWAVFWVDFTFPYAPCMEYHLPTFGWLIWANVGKYSIHGAYGKVKYGDFRMKHAGFNMKNQDFTMIYRDCMYMTNDTFSMTWHMGDLTMNRSDWKLEILGNPLKKPFNTYCFPNGK